MNILYFIGSLIIGLLMIRFHKWLVDNTGRIDFAERYLGMGGTYTFWLIMGVLLIVFGFWVLFAF